MKKIVQRMKASKKPETTVTMVIMFRIVAIWVWANLFDAWMPGASHPPKDPNTKFRIKITVPQTACKGILNLNYQQCLPVMTIIKENTPQTQYKRIPWSFNQLVPPEPPN